MILTNRDLTTPAKNKIKETSKDYKISYRKIDLDNLYDRLKEFASQFGCLDTEIEAGIRQLIGQVSQITITPKSLRRLSKEDLIKAFTGYAKTRRITLQQVSEKFALSLKELASKSKMEQWDYYPILRLEKSKLEELLHSHSLICISGDGGVGKTTLLWHVLHDSRKIVIVDKAKFVDRSWIEDSIRDFRGLSRLPQFLDNDIQIAIERLRIANPDIEGVVLLLGFDGIDEGIDFGQKKILQKILRNFYKAETQRRFNDLDATLIVTCRKEADFFDFLDVYMSDQNQLPILKLQLFSEEERKKAYEIHFPELVYSADDIQRYYLDRYLRFPLLWQALLDVAEKHRKSALLGNPKGLTCLSEKLLDIIVWKLKRRIEKLSDGLDLQCSRKIMLSFLEFLGEAEKPVSECNSYLTSLLSNQVLGYNFLKELRSIGVIKKLKDCYIQNFEFLAKYCAGENNG